MANGISGVEQIVFELTCGDPGCGHSDLEHQAFNSGFAAGIRGQADRVPFTTGFPELQFAWSSGYSAGVLAQDGYYDAQRRAAMSRDIIETSTNATIKIGNTGSGYDCHVIVEIEGSDWEWHTVMRPIPSLHVASGLVGTVSSFPDLGQLLLALRKTPAVVSDYSEPSCAVIRRFVHGAWESNAGESGFKEMGVILLPGEALALAVLLIDNAAHVMI